jgi:HAMP domain-containing protein
MLKNLKLASKFNLLLLGIFLLVVSLSSLILSVILERYTEQVITGKALLLIETMGAVRDYTSNQINPELAPRLETEEQFLPQTVPGYSAREVFEGLRTRPDYREFFYKEATLNPTNLRDKADSFEAEIVEAFRQDKNLKEKTGFRSLPSGDIFFIARPLVVSKESCLRCHSSPSVAPKSQLVTYGDRNGFGWQLNEIVGAKMISVPASRVSDRAKKLQLIVLGLLTAFLLGTIGVINLFMRKTVTNPLQKMSRMAQQVSTGDMSPEFEYKYNDEIGILAASLNRLKISLQIAMNMLDEEKKS